MITPPRTIERLLAGLGAKPDFRNAVLGDLAEEFASRVDANGIESATRWYRREAVRAVPHLFRSWLRGVRLGDVGHIAGVIITVYVRLAAIALILGGVIVGVVQVLGYQDRSLPWSNLLASSMILSCLLLFGGVFSTLAGYLAAGLDSRAPLVTAASFGTLLLLGALLVPHMFSVPVPSRFPTWYLTAVPIVEFLGTIVGGVLRVRAPRPENLAT
jgi:hypothetical protein